MITQLIWMKDLLGQLLAKIKVNFQLMMQKN